MQIWLMDQLGLLEIINHFNFSTTGLSGLTAKVDVSSIKLTERAQAMGSTKSPYEWLSDQAKVSESCFY